MTTGSDWEDGARRLVEGLRAALGDLPADGAGECRWCPHCQLRAVARGDRPEVTAALADVLSTTAGALRAFAAAAPAPGAQGADTAAGPFPAPDEEPVPPAPAVQRIELG